ncbi:MAG: hypothetical protein V4495_27515 [Pseudomonadota bacterium]
MKTSLTDWLITALAYIVICAVLSIINNEEDKVPGADQPEQRAAPASQAAATLHASVSASVHASMSAQLATKITEQHTERAALHKLTQEAERMTGFGASVQ